MMSSSCVDNKTANAQWTKHQNSTTHIMSSSLIIKTKCSVSAEGKQPKSTSVYYHKKTHTLINLPHETTTHAKDREIFNAP